MTTRGTNIKLLVATLLSLLLLSEFLLRLYGVELRIFLSGMSRKNKVSSYSEKFITDAKNFHVTEKTFNIYFLGESTVWGVPYDPQLSLPSIVDYRLGGTLSGRPVRVINLSSPAKDSAYVHFVFELLLRKKEIFHPSLIVIYSGHNEFLKFHPAEPDFHQSVLRWMAYHSELARELLTLIARSKGEISEMDLRDFSDKSIFPFDPHGYEKVINRYRKYFLSMVKLAEKEKIQILISTLVSNYSTWEPNRSVYCSSSAALAQKKQFSQDFNMGMKAEKQQDYSSALTAYQKALSICDEFAEVYFREGKVYQSLNEFGKAWDAYQKAIDYDGMPIRASSAQNNFILSLKRDHVHVIDSVDYLRQHLPDALLDDGLIIDGVHPNLEGYLLIGEAIADKIHSLFGSSQDQLKPLTLDTAKKIFQLDQSKMFEVSYSTGRWITRLASWRYDRTERLKTAEDFFHQAIEIDPKRYEGYTGLAMTSFMKEDGMAAENFLQKSLMIDGKHTEEYFHKPWNRKILKRFSVKSSIPVPTFF